MGGGLCGRRGWETTSVVHSMHLVDVHNIYTPDGGIYMIHTKTA